MRQHQLPWHEADPLSDMWATPAESCEFITSRYRRAWAHSDATIDALALDAIGHVPWWPPDQNEVTLQHILVRIATDTGRHAGQADIIRELIDGTAGRAKENTNLPSADQAWWQAHRDQVERAAKETADAGNVSGPADRSSPQAPVLVAPCMQWEPTRTDDIPILRNSEP